MKKLKTSEKVGLALLSLLLIPFAAAIVITSGQPLLAVFIVAGLLGISGLAAAILSGNSASLAWIELQDRRWLTVCVVVIPVLFVVVWISTGDIRLPIISLGVIFLLPVALLIVCFGPSYIAVGMHELGHFVAGKMFRMRLHHLRIGIFAVQVVNGRNVWYTTPQRGANVNGLCVMTTRDGQFHRYHLAGFILGGPVASLLFLFAVLFIDKRLFDKPSPTSLPQFLMVFVTFLAFTVVCGSIIPFRIRGMPTDALIFLQYVGFLPRPDWSNRFFVWHWLFTGQRPSELPIQEIESSVIVAPSPEARITAKLFAYYYYLEVGDTPAALARITSAELDCRAPIFNEQFRQAALYEASYAKAMFTSDTLSAQVAYATGRQMNVMSLGWLRLRAQAAIALAKGDFGKAEACAVKAIELIERKYQGVAPSMFAEIEWNEAIIAAAKDQRDLGATGAEVATAP